VVWFSQSLFTLKCEHKFLAYLAKHNFLYILCIILYLNSHMYYHVTLRRTVKIVVLGVMWSVNVKIFAAKACTSKTKSKIKENLGQKLALSIK